MKALVTLIQLEIYKIITKPRSFIGFAAITSIVFIVQFALYIDGKTYWEFVTQSLEQTFTIDGTIFNGNLVCFIILQMLLVQMPLMIALVTGDLISGESATGTIRLVATKPVSRAQILLAKYIAGAIYTLLVILWLGVIAYGLSMIIFGHGDLIVLKSDGMVIIRDADVTWRFFAAFFVAFLSLMVVATFSLMLSCFTDNSIGPIIITMAVIILFTIIGTIDIPLFDRIKPFLFTTHMIVWRNIFDNPIPKEQILQSVVILALHIAGFLGISFYHLTNKDIQN
jgi:ABC-2 type transport system permease protein